MTNRMDPNRLVTVCAECLTAACWQGEFMCENSRTAGTTERTVAHLRNLALEDPHYWNVHR